MLIDLCLVLWLYLVIITYIAPLLGSDYLNFMENLDFSCRVESVYV